MPGSSLPPRLLGLAHQLRTDTSRKLADSVRTTGAEDFLERVRPVAAGVGVTRVADIGGLDRVGIPVCTAIRPTARSLATSQGKGTSLVAARISAVMEAIEVWHAERHHLPVRLATFDQLVAEGERVADVANLVRCPCNEYSDDRVLRWTRSLLLPTESPAWVPYEAVHCDWRVPAAEGEHSFQNGTNGLASGGTATEAVVHALCELVERDAIVAFQDRDDAEQAPCRVRPESVDDPVCRDLLDRFERAGIEMVIWDMTSDLGLATFSCTAVEVAAPWHQPLPQARGSGTHPQREIALQRALTEAAQARAAIIAGSRDDIFFHRYQEYFGPGGRAEAAAEAVTPARRDFAEVPSIRHDRVVDDLGLVLDRLAARGHDEVHVVDLTHPQWSLPVVKALVPGLRWRPWED